MSMTLTSTSWPSVHDVARVLDALVLHLGDVDEALDAGLDLHERAEVGDLGDLALHARCPPGGARRACPTGSGWSCLMPRLKRSFSTSMLSTHRLDLVALLELLARVLDALRPGDVGDVHEAVDALLDADEDAEVGDVADLAA